jgi:hypothetical protein
MEKHVDYPYPSIVTITLSNRKYHCTILSVYFHKTIISYLIIIDNTKGKM